MSDLEPLFALGFDDERPYGTFGDSAEGERFFMKKVGFTQKMNTVFDKEQVPRTHFLLARYIEQMRQRFGKVALSDMYLTGSPHLELQQHSYAHAPFRPLPNVSQPEMTPTQFGLDVIKANRVLNDVLGMTPTGLRTPYGYSYDLFTMPELLNMLRVAGINYVSSHLRSGEDSAVMGPSVAEGQPHTYAGRGYSDIVEVPSHGYQDVVFTEGKKSLIGREAVHTADEIVQHYARLLDNAIEISIIEEDTHVSVALCLHPWAVMEYDPHVEVLMRIVDKARDKGFKVVSYGQMADMYRLAENDQ